MWHNLLVQWGSCMKISAALLFGLFFSPMAVSFNLLSATKQAIHFDPIYAKLKADSLLSAQVLPEAQSKLLPQLSVHAQHQYQRYNGIEHRGQSAGISVTQALFNMPAFIALKSASSQASAAHWSMVDGYQQLLVRVSSTYFKLAYQQQYVTLLHKQIKASYQLWHQAKLRYKAGQITLSDVLSAEASYNSLLASMQSAQIDWASDKAALMQLTGQAVQTVSVIGRQSVVQPIIPADLSAWLNLAAKHNPALLGAQDQVRSANSNIKMSRAQHFPSISADASYVSSSNRFQDFGSSDQGSTVNVSLNFPIFSGGSMFVDTQSRHYQYASSRAALNQIHAQLVAQVQQNFSALKQGPAEIKQLQRSSKVQHKAYQAMLITYHHGISTMTEVLNARNNWYQSQAIVLQAQYNYLNHAILLKQASGMLSLDDLALINRWLS